jgi:hypothetical protein
MDVNVAFVSDVNGHGALFGDFWTEWNRRIGGGQDWNPGPSPYPTSDHYSIPLQRVFPSGASLEQKFVR